MGFLSKLFGKKDGEKKPTVSTVRQPTSSPVKTQEGTKVCAGCGRTEKKILKDFAEMRKRGVVVIGSGGSGLLYCDNDKKYFCGRCQVDLGYYSGCPICRKALDD